MKDGRHNATTHELGGIERTPLIYRHLHQLQTFHMHSIHFLDLNDLGSAKNRGAACCPTVKESTLRMNNLVCVCSNRTILSCSRGSHWNDLHTLALSPAPFWKKNEQKGWADSGGGGWAVTLRLEMVALLRFWGSGERTMGERWALPRFGFDVVLAEWVLFPCVWCSPVEATAHGHVVVHDGFLCQVMFHAPDISCWTRAWWFRRANGLI